MPQTAYWPPTRADAQHILNQHPDSPPQEIHTCKICGDAYWGQRATNGRIRRFCSKRCYYKHNESSPGFQRYRTSPKGKAMRQKIMAKHSQKPSVKETRALKAKQNAELRRMIYTLDPSQKPQSPWATCSTTDCQNIPSKKRARSCSACSWQAKVANRPNTWRNAGKPCVECGTPLGRWQGKYCSTRCSNRAGGRAERKKNPERYRIRRNEQKRRSSRRRRLQKLELCAQGAFLKQCLHCDATFDSFTHKGRLKTYCTERCENRAREYRRRARKQNAFVEVVSKKKLLKWQHGRCYHCNCKIRLDVEAPHPKSLTLDHLVPLALGGEHSYANTAASCWDCNCTIKGTKAINEQLKLV